MKTTIITLAITLCSLLASCEDKPLPATEQPTKATTNPLPSGPAKKGFEAQYTEEAKKAFAAQGAYARERTDEAYAQWGAHIYLALRFKIMHERENGEESVARFYKLGAFQKMFTDWKKSLGGHSAAEQIPVLKEAKKKYTDLQ